MTANDVLTTTRALFDLIDREAPATESGATLSPAVVEAFHEQGLFGLMIPKELGGTEADLLTTLAVYEEASRADGSTGWSLLANATTSAFAAAYCGDDAVAAMFGGDRFPTHAGQFSPRGTAQLQDDGSYVVAGRYSFGSGSGHSNWMGGGAIEMRAGEMVMAPSGLPVIRAIFVPRENVEFLGNWDVMGLTGTGSYDYEVPEQVVEESFTFDLINARAQRGGPVYRLGVMGLTAVGHAAFALGVGRRALDELLAVLATKHRLGASQPLRDQQKFRFEFAHHDAALLSARAFVYESFASVQDTLFAGDDPAPVQRARLRQSTTYVTHVAEEAVRFAYTTAGTDALRPGALQRCFRDIHAATQHLVVDDSTFVDATAVLLEQGELIVALADLTGHVAVVTGAGSGIGRSLAVRFADAGMRVVAADVEGGALTETMALLSDDAIACVTDVSNRDDVFALADTAFGECGAVDVLCNNAGVFQGGLMWETSPADFEWTLGVNLWGILHGIAAFVPRMVAQGTDGHVVNTVSMAGLASTPYSGAYNVSKFAAMAATECLAHDLAATGARIGVSALCPGLVATGIAHSRRNRPESLASEQTAAADFVEQALRDSAAAQGRHPDEVAGLVVDAIRNDEFLVPTRDSYARQLTERAEDLTARSVPRSPAFD